ncbi:MAG: outer membrane protein assembly factor BamB family protein [Planctomycetota bacterium]
MQRQTTTGAKEQRTKGLPIADFRLPIENRKSEIVDRKSLCLSSSVPLCFCAFLIPLIMSTVAIADDWPTYRSDPARSAITSQTVGPRLFLQWTYTPVHAPKPAWPMPSEELPRMHNDNAYHVVMADNCAVFGSCTTNKVTSIDVATGQIRWTFFTEGPVRFAPALYDGKVYVGSDDGYVYCIDGQDGSLEWQYRAGPSEEKIIGNGRMISLWPVRTGVLVDDGVVYFAAGVFPYEGLYICALRAGDGSVLWKNDTLGDRAHELEFGGISPHGYLVASRQILYVPSGRSMPAAFDRKTGKFLYCASPGGNPCRPPSTARPESSFTVPPPAANGVEHGLCSITTGSSPASISRANPPKWPMMPGPEKDREMRSSGSPALTWWSHASLHTS